MSENQQVIKYAILQLGEEKEETHQKKFESLDYLKSLQLSPVVDDYEIIYIQNTGQNEKMNLEKLYDELNTGGRIENYYGHSLSISDVVVVQEGIEKPNYKAFYCDKIGFTKLNDDFVTQRLISRIKDDIDVRKEYEILKNRKSTSKRFQYLQEVYQPIFEMIDKANNENSISFYVAESMEYTQMGKIYDNIPSIEEALEIYNNIPAERKNMENGIGVNVAGVNYSLYQNGDVDTLEFYEDDIRENEDIKKAITSLHNYVADIYIEKYEGKGFEFLYKEDYNDKYKKNLYHNLQKYEDLGYEDKSIVFLAKMNNRYINTDNWNLNSDMSFEEIKKIVDLHSGIIKFSELENTDYVVLDAETTGFGKDDEIIELGITDKNGNVLYEEMFHPNKELNEEASKVNGITMNDLAFKPSFGNEVENIIEVIGDKPIVIYNKDFDTRLFMQTLEAHKDDVENYSDVIEYLKQKFDNNTYCAMQSYTEFKDDFKATKLVEALAEQGIEKEQNHRAVSDCIDTVNLIHICAEKERNKSILAEDITNIKGTNREYNAGMRETTYTFECDVQGVHDILTYDVSKHDNDVSYTIHTENNDIWNIMTESELEKLEAVLSREAVYFDWEDRINKANSLYELRDVSYGFYEAENLNLSQIQMEKLYEKIGVKEKFLYTIADREQDNRRTEEMEQKVELSYFVAEAMEFHNLGSMYENISTIEEAINVYENLPKTSRIMGNGIGVFVNGDEYTLYEGGQVDTLEFYEESIKTNKDILNAVKVLNEHFSNVRENKIIYGGFDYTVIDKWQNNEGTYAVGQLEADDGTWYVAKVTDTTEQYHGEYEYEFSTDKPTRSEVEEMHLNKISEIDIDRHEAEYGADGNKTFPDFNAAEKITLHLKYLEPINVNGFIVENDTITFDSKDELDKYVNREPAFDILDNTITKKDNEILLYTENENGEILSLYEVINMEEMKEYGYTWEGMIPLSQEQTTELFNNGIEVYKIYQNSSEGLIENIEDIINHAENGGMFGIEKEVADNHIIFEKRPDEKENINEFKVLQELNHSKDSYNGIETWEFECEVDGKTEKAAYIQERFAHPFQEEQIKEVVKIGEKEIDNQSDAKIVRDKLKSFIAFREMENEIANADLKTIHDLKSEFENVDKEYGVFKDDVVFVLNDRINEIKTQLDEREAVLSSQNKKTENQSEINLGDDTVKKNGIMTEGKMTEGDNTVKSSVEKEKENEKANALDELTIKLQEGIEKTLDSEEFANWCRKQGKLFHNNYSFNNAMLTYLQKPDATYVCGYENWKDFGRQVKYGSKAIKILTPQFAANYKGQGSFFSSIKKTLQGQLDKDDTLDYATYRLGKSKFSFNMYRNGLFDVNFGEKNLMAHITSDEMRKFMEQNVIGKVPVGYGVAYVYDISDTIEPDFLYVAKNKCRKDEVLFDAKGKPITNNKGQYKIKNSEERTATFRTDIDMTLKPMETDKMQILYETLQSISAAKGIPMSEISPQKDETLQGGALGYYRHPSEQYQMGNIVISSELDVTDKVAVAFHEIAHSDLHSDIEWLKDEMDLDAGEKITRQMKEVQAEAVAYMTASTFGIETSHKSFNYIANWSDGRGLESLKKSIDVIYKESKELLKCIEKDLDEKGFDMAMQVKDKTPLSPELKTCIVKDYMEFTLNTMRSNETIQQAAFDALKDTDNTLQQTILKEQVSLAQKIDEKLMTVNSMVAQFERSEDKQEQVSLKYRIEAAKDVIINMQSKIESLSDERLESIKEENKNNIKQMFINNPAKAFNMLKKDFPELKDLPKSDVKFIISSQFLLTEYKDLLGKDNAKFVEKAMEHLENFHNVLSKNKTAVEITWCEQWGKEPIFTNGTLLHPKEANRIIANAEKEIKILKNHAEKNGEYYPYSKCMMNIYSFDNKDNLTVATTRIDIGDGTQKDLKEHLTDALGLKGAAMLENFQKSIRERNTADKIILPSKGIELDSNELQNDTRDNGKLSREEWQNTMDGNGKYASDDKEIENSNLMTKNTERE